MNVMRTYGELLSYMEEHYNMVQMNVLRSYRELKWYYNGFRMLLNTL